MKKFLLFAVAAVMLAACSKDAINEQSITNPFDEAPETLTVGFEDDQTRIELNEAQKTVWTKGDLVSVFYRSDANQKWQYTGETGERVAELTRVDAGVATEAMKRVVVVYPYSENYYINTETYNVQATLPAVQNYLKDSYGLEGNIMISSSEYNQFSLKSVCGWLKLQLTGNGEKITSITLKGNNGEQVAGEIYINSADASAALAADMGSADDNDNSAGGNLVFEDTILTEVTLNCGDGVTLSAEPTAFYIGLPPQEFTQGISLEIKATDGHIMTKSTNKSVLINRNAIQPMAAVDFVPSYPLSNEIFYTATAMVTPYASDVFGANIVSNIYDAEKDYGVITFDSPVTSIGDSAFRVCLSLTSVTIPDSVAKIGYGAFIDCCSLTSVTIPDSVTSIETGAFQGCNKLTEVTIPDSVTSVGTSAFAFCDCLKSFYGKSVSEDNRCLIVNGTLKAFAPADLLEYTIPSEVASIGESAFRGCNKLTNITIPNSVTGINSGVFKNCDNLAAFYGKFASDDNRCLIVNGVLKSFAPAGLTEYEIENGVTSIEEYVFYSCSSLISVTIPDTVTQIGRLAFANCTKLNTVYCKATTPPAGGWYMFSHYYTNDESPLGCTIYVPAESFEAYKAAQYWSEYADNLVAYDFEKGEVVVPGTTIEFDPNHCIYYRANMTGGWDSGYGNYRAYRSYIKFDSSKAGSNVSVIEMKFKLKEIPTNGDAYLGSGSNRAKDSCDELYITNSSLRFYSSANDDSFSKTWNWTDLGVNYTDLITLQISAADDTVTVNGKVQQCDGFIMPSFSYLFSSYYREYDEGEWKEYEGVPDGSALYYVKMLTSTGKVAYLGYAAKAVNPATNKLEHCWYSKYSDGTETYQFAHDAINQGGYTGNF